MSLTHDPRVFTGVAGLDQILHGGLIPKRAYLIRGGPGSGKTTLGMHFLVADNASNSLLVTLGEDEAQLRDNARRSGLSLDGVDVLDVSPGQASDGGSDTYNLLESWDVEGNSTHDKIIDHVRAHRPKRVLIDSLSQMRYLSADTFQFRKQVLSVLRALCSGQVRADTVSSRNCQFDFPWRLIGQGRVESAAVVLHLDILDHIPPCRLVTCIPLVGQPLAFQ